MFVVGMTLKFGENRNKALIPASAGSSKNKVGLPKIWVDPISAATERLHIHFYRK